LRRSKKRSSFAVVLVRVVLAVRLSVRSVRTAADSNTEKCRGADKYWHEL